MTPQERKHKILLELNEKGKVDVGELSDKYNCSKVTIRSDIRALEAEGLLTRTHGGAVLISKEEDYLYSYKSLYRNVPGKKEISACAYQCIHDHDTIFVDDSSTSFYLAVELKEHPEKHVAVITNSLLVGNELAECNHIELYIVGGHVKGTPAASMGEDAERTISGLHVDKGFIGVHSINPEAGLTSIATPQMQIKKAVLSVSDEVYVLADSSKFGGGYVSVVCPVNAVHMIITDSRISRENLRKAREYEAPLVIAEKI